MDLVADTLSLLDYRRRVAELYRTVRISPPGPDTWQVWRSGRDELFATHARSPLEQEDHRRRDGLEYFDYDPQWRFVLDVEPVEPGDVTAVHSSDGSTPLRKIGRVRLPIGDEPTLSLYRFVQYADGLFVPFRDVSAGMSTYGGGRYLLDSPKGADLGNEEDRLILDFNYAYHPSCVYSHRWSCPLAPPDNRLEIPIPAGERL